MKRQIIRYGSAAIVIALLVIAIVRTDSDFAGVVTTLTGLYIGSVLYWAYDARTYLLAKSFSITTFWDKERATIWLSILHFVLLSVIINNPAFSEGVNHLLKLILGLSIDIGSTLSPVFIGFVWIRHLKMQRREKEYKKTKVV